MEGCFDRPLESTVSMVPNKSDSSSACCFRYQDVSLADHAATLQDYFREYRSTEQDTQHHARSLSPELHEGVLEQRTTAFDKCTQYLLSTCYPKMRA